MNPIPAESAARRPPSLALRLTLLIGASTAVLFLSFGWVVLHSIKDHFAAQDAGELEALVHDVQEALSDERHDRNISSMQRSFAEASVGHHGMFLYVEDADGRAIFSSARTGLPAMARSGPTVDHIAPETLAIWQVAAHSYRGAVLRLGHDADAGHRPFLVVVAKSIDFHLRYLATFRTALWVTTVGSSLITFLVVWWAVYQGHAPLRRIIGEIRRITTDRLHVRLSPDTVPIELAELATSFNDMLERIEEVFRKLANFSDDIAHELRTPITNLMTQTQVALSTARSLEEYREILYSNLEEYERMAQMVGDMLFLAKADNGQLKPSITEVDLATEVRALFEYFEAWAQERDICLALEGAAPAVTGDRLMLRRAISNLLSNAIRRTPRGSTVTVRLTTSGDEVRVGVENPGLEIPQEHLPRLFDRFYRVDPSRHRDGEGAGLGLSIVKSIVIAHGGTVGVTWADGSVRFQIRLPKRAEAR